MNSAHWPGVINNGHTTGKSIECRVSEWTRYPCSALIVVVNAQADALMTSSRADVLL